MIRGVLLGMELWTAQSWGVDCFNEHLGCFFGECDVDSFGFYVDFARNKCRTNLSHSVQMARWSVNYWQNPSRSPKLTWEWFIFAIIIRYDAICSQLISTNYIMSGCVWTWCIATNGESDDKPLRRCGLHELSMKSIEDSVPKGSFWFVLWQILGTPVLWVIQETTRKLNATLIIAANFPIKTDTNTKLGDGKTLEWRNPYRLEWFATQKCVA